jgi:hypothetical protein
MGARTWIWRVLICSGGMNPRKVSGPLFDRRDLAQAYIDALKRQVYAAPMEYYEIHKEPM